MVGGKEHERTYFRIITECGEEKVVYRNRYGLDITRELYFEKGISLDQKHPALIVASRPRFRTAQRRSAELSQ